MDAGGSGSSVAGPVWVIVNFTLMEPEGSDDERIDVLVRTAGSCGMRPALVSVCRTAEAESWLPEVWMPTWRPLALVSVPAPLDGSTVTRVTRVTCPVASGALTVMFVLGGNCAWGIWGNADAGPD